MQPPPPVRALLLTLAVLAAALTAAGCGGNDGEGKPDRKDSDKHAPTAAEPTPAERVKAGRVSAPPSKGSKPSKEEASATGGAGGSGGSGGGAGAVVTPPPSTGPTLAYCTGVRGAAQAWARGVSCGEAARLLTGFDPDAGTSPALRAAGWSCARGGEAGGVVEYACSDGTGADAGTVGIQVTVP